MKTLAVVVTYNRCDLLSRCLNYLEQQSHPLDAILVINNASTDNTVEMLESRDISYITQENVGSAGGWHRGIQYALDEGFDAIWLMDDDGFPDIHALENLLPYLHEDTACVSSIVVRENDPSHFVFPFPVLDENRLPVLLSGKRKITTVFELQDYSKNGMYDFAHFFNGALINIQAIRSIGNVNIDYFMFGDEVDYFFRLQEFGPVMSVLNAIHYHPDVTSRPYSAQKVYYYVKNTIILNKKYFDHIILRDLLSIIAVLWRTARRNGLGIAMRYLVGGDDKVLYRAIWRGLKGKVGKDYENK